MRSCAGVQAANRSWEFLSIFTGGMVVIAVAMLCTSATYAEPFIPQSDAQVLERLPTAINTAKRELRKLRDQLVQDPRNVDLATRLARRYIEIGRAEFDPRYFGYAEAALQPWWKMAPPPPEVLVLRAILRQHRHDFADALNDLSLLLRLEPRNAQAWLSRAVILQVQGNHADALRHCVMLLYLSGARALTTTCLSKSLSLSGQAEKGYQALHQALEKPPTTTDDRERLWALTVLAEIAARLDKLQVAEQHFREALSLGLRDSYLFMAYADFLLDQNRPEEVQALLKDETRVDSLLLRLAFAEQRLESPELAAHMASLQARFTASRMRGDSIHLGEEARFTLHLLKKPRQALPLAQANWAVQREPRDARILLEAALAAHDPQAAKPVLEMLERTAMEDVQLRRLAAKFKESP